MSLNLIQKKRHDTTIELTNNKNFLSNNYIVDVFLFTTTIISVLVTTLAMYLLYNYKKVKMLVASLALQQIKDIAQ